MTPAAVAAGPSAADADVEVKKQELIKEIFGSKTVDKENEIQHEAVPLVKRQRFVPPAHGAARPLRPAQQQKVAHAALTASTSTSTPCCTREDGGGASTRIFSVLYTKRDKWRVKLLIVVSAQNSAGYSCCETGVQGDDERPATSLANRALLLPASSLTMTPSIWVCRS